MIGDIIRLYRIGRELGLSKKDLNRILLFDDTKRPRVYTLLLFLILFLILIVSIFSTFTIQSYVFKNTYARGTMYSTIQIKDFKIQKVRKLIIFSASISLIFFIVGLLLMIVALTQWVSKPLEKLVSIIRYIFSSIYSIFIQQIPAIDNTIPRIA